MEIWIRTTGQAATTSSQRGGSESSRDSEQDGELGSLSASDVRFSFSFCRPSYPHTHQISSVSINDASLYVFGLKDYHCQFDSKRGNAYQY